MKLNKTICSLIVLFSFTGNITLAQSPLYSRLLAATVMDTWKKDSFALEGKPAYRWSYDQGVLLEGIANLWKQTSDKSYFEYIQKSMDFYVNENGTIKTYNQEDFNIDNIKNGRALLFLYRVTGLPKCWKAATILREQLNKQPRTKEGGFWHKKIYPNQMWLDGLYMAEPFYTEYAMLAHQDNAFDDIANQFIFMENHARDGKTGLLYHGWDESKEMGWANKVTGNSPNFWARAMGWYALALVDVLENFPQDHPKRKKLVEILNRLVTALENVQDKKTGLWYDIPDKPNETGNYPEASASSMFVAAVAKGVRLNLISAERISIAEKGYKGIIDHFIRTENGRTNLNGIVSVSGLGGKPYRDGSIAYYLKEPVVTNDPKGIGACIIAATEMEMLPTLLLGKGKKILLDGYFNHEISKDITGATIQTHYIWNEMDNGGYSFLGGIFNRYGIETNLLTTPVSTEILKNTDIYFIIDPDWPKENPSPHYILPEHINAIYNWVKEGGVLMLFSNDSGNVEFPHYNQLAEKFGIHFNENNPRNMVKGNDFSTGTIAIPADNLILNSAKNIYIKEISSLSLQSPAKPALTDKGDNIIGVAKVGKGTVFAIGDPWLYNEYLDGRKLPASLENFKAAEDLVRWLIKQVNN